MNSGTLVVKTCCEINKYKNQIAILLRRTHLESSTTLSSTSLSSSTLFNIITRLSNPSLNNRMFYYIDQHRLLACLQPKVVMIDVEHIIILFCHVNIVKGVKSRKSFEMVYAFSSQVASTSLHGHFVSLAPPALKKKLDSIEKVLGEGLRVDQVNRFGFGQSSLSGNLSWCFGPFYGFGKFYKNFELGKNSN